MLANPEPQPTSIWSKLPSEVIRRMACVVDLVRVNREELWSDSSRYLIRLHFRLDELLSIFAR